jgi:1,4-dihydroxy-2-naphthoyl-CoA hydrolase
MGAAHSAAARAAAHRPKDIERASATLAFSTQPHDMPSLWKQALTVQTLTDIHKDTAVERLGIEFLEVGDDFIRARVPVDARTRQPYGILHGGVSVVLAETLGSCGAAFAAPEGHRAVGLDINANHLRATTTGWVTGTARPVHVGRTTQVWQIDLQDEQGRLTCVSRITMAVLAPQGT